MIVGKQFAPVCRRFTLPSPRRQLRRPAHARAILSVVRPVRPQQAARYASLDRRSIRHDNLPTNHSLRAQDEYPKPAYRQSSLVLFTDSSRSCTIHSSPLSCSVSLLVATSSPLLRPVYLPGIFLDRSDIQYHRNVCAFISRILGVWLISPCTIVHVCRPALVAPHKSQLHPRQRLLTTANYPNFSHHASPNRYVSPSRSAKYCSPAIRPWFWIEDPGPYLRRLRS